MLATTALALALVLPASAGSSGRYVWSQGSGAIRRDVSGSWLDLGGLQVRVLGSDGSGTFEGVMAYAADEGLMYIHGGTAAYSMVAVGLCADAEEGSVCQLRVVALSDEQCAEQILEVGWDPSDRDGDILIGTTRVMTEEIWNDASGVASGDFFFEARLSPATSSRDDGDVDPTATLFGFYDQTTDTAYLSGWGEDACSSWVVQQQAACSVNSSGRLACRGDADLWLGRLGATTGLSFWGYEHMTTVKGFTSTTLPHLDGLIIE
jgi:hypothetical protein